MQCSVKEKITFIRPICHILSFNFVCFRGSNFHPGFKLSPLHNDEVSKSKIKIHDISQQINSNYEVNESHLVILFNCFKWYRNFL